MNEMFVQLFGEQTLFDLCLFEKMHQFFGFLVMTSKNCSC